MSPVHPKNPIEHLASEIERIHAERPEVMYADTNYIAFGRGDNRPYRACLIGLAILAQRPNITRDELEHLDTHEKWFGVLHTLYPYLEDCRVVVSDGERLPVADALNHLNVVDGLGLEEALQALRQNAVVGL